MTKTPETIKTPKVAGDSGYSDQTVPGQQALIYEPSKAAWATNEFIRESPPWLLRSAAYMALAVLTLGAIYAHLTEVPVTFDAGGTLVTERAPVVVKSSATFRAGSVHVKENQKVNANTALVVGEDQLGTAMLNRLEEDRVSVLKFISNLRSGQCPRCWSRAQTLSEEAFQGRTNGNFNDQLSPIQELLKELSSSLKQVEQSDATTQSLRRQITLNQQKINEIKNQRAVHLLATQIEQLTNEIVGARAQLEERRQAQTNSVALIANRLEVRLGALPSAIEQYRKAMVVVAPVSGTVIKLSLNGPGDLVAANQELMWIVPSEDALVAELNINNRDISQVFVGQEVLLKLDALPEREFGTVKAKVESIPIATFQSNSDAPPTYLIRARLDSQSVIKNEQTYPFKFGMTFQGLMISKRQSLLRLGIRKLFNLKDEYFVAKKDSK